ncbi:CTP1 [Symbiodinium sp. KB8]|nr:CTP1 [Symbiodinium sp. KB8]
MQLNAKGSNNPFVVAADIVKSNGVRGLYYGLPAFLTQTSMKAAIRFTAYETCKTLLVETMGLSGTAVSTNLLSGLVAGALRTILTEQGIAGLYKGITPTALRQASSVGVRFMLYEPTKSLYMKLTGQDKPNTFITMMSGGTVGGLSVILNNPIDVVKSKIQSQSKSDLPPKYTSTMQCFRSVLAEDGMRGFAAGLLPRVVRVFCGQAVTFVVYEHIVQLVNQMFPN